MSSHLKLSFEIWPNMPWGRLEIAGPASNSWGDKSIDWCINRIADYGYEGFDVVYPKIMELRPHEYEEEVKRIRSTMTKRNIAFPSIACHTTFVTPRHFDRDNGIAKFKKAIDAAADMGAETVVTLVGDGYYDPPLYNVMTRKEAWHQVVTATREAADYAKQYDIDISIELIQGTIINDIASMLKLFEEVDRPNVYCCVDVGTFYTTVKPKMPIKEAIRKLGDRIKVVHVKDEVGFPNIMQSQHVWFGGGFVDFSEMAEALKEVGYSHYNAVEWEAWQAGGLFGVGEPSGIGLSDFDRVAEESKEFLEEFGWGLKK
ncbi:sugar phosphate isomerase/epimerase family protein [Salimicrobium halophilum]|uniref:Sugar phosphate isomerase/epimerase n=1 Tax=Salimicrobium halophilum TaxID=86666 RepID=A0A1G8SAW5_9BACI|nr:sugar phosphate isomerase/epimerase family protein [Salimicrobium halophilum]SDJ26337.1 Sugar phosphate isomerase/epimerase [Salimicrobium halophilum]